jgi:hypothetical protein
MPKIKVFITQFNMCCGPVVSDNPQDVIIELTEMINEMETPSQYILVIDEMEQSEFDSLKEFEGY